ncbi:MAG: rhodanese-like domain-containing protein [Pseudomonadota bacterium]
MSTESGKGVAEFLEAANAVVPKVAAADAMAWLGSDDTVFLDVRPAAAIAETGTVEGAVQIPRGLLEFNADPDFVMHNPAMDKAKRVVVFCALGGQAALAGKTLKDMGYGEVLNGGGIQDWKDAGAPIVTG